MIPNKQQHGVDVPVLLPSDNAATRIDMIHCNAGESPTCSVSECLRPVYTSLADENYCEMHYNLLCLAEVLSRLGCDPHAPVGVARYVCPASREWTADYAWLRCDRSSCDATYVGQYDPVPICKYCLRAAGLVEK